MKETANPIIGIVVRNVVEKGDSIFEINENYRIAVVEAGGIPLLICPTDNFNYGVSDFQETNRLNDIEREKFYKILSLCDGFVMTGGDSWYDYDEIICQYAYDFDLPLLGICLGMQILANMDNFSHDRILDTTVLNKTNINHCQINTKYVHRNILFPSKLKEIFNENEILVNSRHNYHVTEKDWFLTSCVSEDGLIEGIEIPDKFFMIGVQWHPETMIFYNDKMKLLFKSLVDATIFVSKNKKLNK